MPNILQILRNSGSKTRVGFCRFWLGSNHFIKEIPCHIAHYSLNNQARYLEVQQIIMFCQNWRLKIKRLRAWNMRGIYWCIHWSEWSSRRCASAGYRSIQQFFKIRPVNGKIDRTLVMTISTPGHRTLSGRRNTFLFSCPALTTGSSKYNKEMGCG